MIPTFRSVPATRGLTSARSALTASVWVLSAAPFGWAMATAHWQVIRPTAEVGAR